MNPSLYMHTWVREQYLSRHRFFVEQVNKRVLSQYSNIEAEADEFARAEYERMGQHYPEGDDGSAAEEAWPWHRIPWPSKRHAGGNEVGGAGCYIPAVGQGPKVVP